MQDVASLRELYKTYLPTRNINVSPQTLYDPVNYIMGLGGKHIRAVFTLLGYSLYATDAKQALSAAYALELFHNFSLMHDDIMDEASTRRGQPSVHAQFGTNSGILSGDVMMIKVYEELLKIENPKRRYAILELFTKTAREVCEGQQYDMDFERQEEVSINAYMKMIKLKTAVLLAASLKVGAILAAAPSQDAEQLYNFGINIGISFQIQDDILDTYGAKAQVGKMIGGDIQQNKKTILYLKALEMIGEERMAFQSLYASELKIEEKLDKVKTIMDRHSVRQSVEGLQNQYFDKAIMHLDQLSVKHKGVEELKKLALFIVKRKN